MKKYLILLAFECLLSAALGQQQQINLLTGTKITGGTGVAILSTSGTTVDTVKAASALQVLRLNASGNGFEFYTPSGGSSVVPSALTKSDDTNVTLTLGGTPLTALLQPVSLTLGWSGTLADSRIASSSAWNGKKANNDSISMTGYTSIYRNTLNLLKSDTALMLLPYLRSALTSLNGLTNANQTFSIGSAGLDYNIASSGTDHKFNLPSASASSRGALTSADWTTFNNKVAFSDTTTKIATKFDIASRDTILASNVVSTGTFYSDIFTIPIAANEKIYFRAVIYATSSASNGSRYMVTIPSGATMLSFYNGTASANYSYGPTSWMTVSATEGTTITPLTSSSIIIRVEGWVKTSGTAGNVIIGGRSGIGTNTMQWVAGSWVNVNSGR